MSSNNKVKAVIICFANALQEFYKNDEVLIKNGSMERACVARICVYLDKYIKTCKTLQQDNLNWICDCEYNRKCGNKKTVETKPKTDQKAINNQSKSNKQLIRPDLIVHERNEPENNLMVVEFKAKNNKRKNSEDNDIKKLKALTNKNGEYKYKIGLFVRLYDTYELTVQKIKIFGIQKEWKNNYRELLTQNNLEKVTLLEIYTFQS